MNKNEVSVPTVKGQSLVFESFDTNPNGTSYVRFIDSKGKELLYYDSEEWATDPIVVMGAIMAAIVNGAEDAKAHIKIQKTEDNYEQYLNDLYEEQPHDDVFHKFEYLTNESRGKSMTSEALNGFIRNGTVGTMLRQFHSIAFQTGLNDWNP
jgi:hypothetical protein